MKKNSFSYYRLALNPCGLPKNSVFVWTLLLALAGFCCVEASGTEGGEVFMMPRTRRFIESMLDDEQMNELRRTLTDEDAWGSLGPRPWLAVLDVMTYPPEINVRLTIPETADGAGTQDDPYVGVISDFLKHYNYEPVSIEAYKGSPATKEIDNYLGRLDYERVIVWVPAGHYAERVTPHVRPYRHQDEVKTAIDVPPGVWLVAEGEVVFSPVGDVPDRSSLVNLNIGAGITGVTLDGGSVPGFRPDPDPFFCGIYAAHAAWIAGNHMSHFSGHGIAAIGNRGREGSLVTASHNIIENIGYSGISAQSRWYVGDNQIRYAGILRPDGGNGDDGIIIRWGIESKVVNNLVVLERRPHARHVLSGQCCHDNLYAGNISIAVGSTRMNIGLSDGSHNNQIIGNLVLTTGDPFREDGNRTQAGIHVNGYGTLIRNNVSIGSVRAFRPLGREGKALCKVIDNYAEFSWPINDEEDGFHRAQYYEAKGNRIRRIDSPLPRPVPKKFGFFSTDQGLW